MKDDIGTLIEPEPVGFSWGAPGWYVLAGLILLTILVLILLIYKHYQKNKYRRSAVSWLERREAEMFSQHPVALVYDAAVLMKRIAITRYGRIEVAGIRDDEWITFLNKCCKAPLFEAHDAEWLRKVLYASKQEVKQNDVRLFIGKTKTWIRKHHYAL